ncbi:hypothetical protein NMY22_g12525 [Coprinellus aureogranulatus]|nr:hypothetical protein NMY22_g12525 [Coprinellus aureogranulatus]
MSQKTLADFLFAVLVHHGEAPSNGRSANVDVLKTLLAPLVGTATSVLKGSATLLLRMAHEWRSQSNMDGPSPRAPWTSIDDMAAMNEVLVYVSFWVEVPSSAARPRPLRQALLSSPAFASRPPSATPHCALPMNVTPNDDVLRHICDLLTPEEVRNASSVHRVFFDRWIKEKYRRVDFTRSDRPSKRLWERVRDNQWIANVVTCVHMKPWLIKPKTQTYQSRTEHVFNTVAMVFDPDHTKKQVKKRFERRLEKDINHIKELFAVLHSVQQYHMEWDNNPDYPSQLFKAFLEPLYSWRDTLTTLSIHIPVDLLNGFVTATLPRLRNIHICLSSGRMSQRKINIHLDGFLVFLHNLKDSLKSLSISSHPSSENLELSRFYKYLGTFPHLRAIALTVPLNGAHLADPRMFCSFIHKHSRTLESLSLQTTRCAPHAERLAPECLNWIQTIIASIQEPFPELEDVTIALRPLRAPLDILTHFIRMHAPTLKSVALTDRMLEWGDVYQHILPAFSSASPLDASMIRLQTLQMRVTAVTPWILSGLATKLPRLKHLKLELADRARMAAHIQDLRKYEDDLDAYEFNGTNWALERLEITPGPNDFWIKALESVLPQRIPALQTIKAFDMTVK